MQPRPPRVGTAKKPPALCCSSDPLEYFLLVSKVATEMGLYQVPRQRSRPKYMAEEPARRPGRARSTTTPSASVSRSSCWIECRAGHLQGEMGTSRS